MTDAIRLYASAAADPAARQIVERLASLAQHSLPSLKCYLANHLPEHVGAGDAWSLLERDIDLLDTLDPQPRPRHCAPFGGVGSPQSNVHLKTGGRPTRGGCAPGG